MPVVTNVLLRPELLARVKTGLTVVDIGNLRVASAAVRASLNSTVTTVVLTTSSPCFSADFGQTFPQATSLKLNIEYKFNDSRETGDFTVLLGFLASNSPAFVRKLQLLEVVMGTLPVTERIATTMRRFFQRCTDLQELRVVWSLNADTARFCGHGASPQERRASMQAQLAAICADPVFLAPASWPAHGCLRQLNICGSSSPSSQPPGEIQLLGGAYSAYSSAAVVTTSLHVLELECDGVAGLEHWQSLGCLAGNLTSLGLRIHNSIGPEAQQAVQAATAQLTSLVRLTVDPDLLDLAEADGDGTVHVLPASWSRLTRLTQLKLLGGSPSMAQMPHFPALQALMLEWCNFESLSGLFGLTALTSVTYEDRYDEEIVTGRGQGDLAVPVQWKKGMQVLEWGYSCHNMGLIAELAALTKLVLCAAEVGPTLCCSLAGLPVLETLVLLDAVVDPLDGGRCITAAAFRPSFAALATVGLDNVAVLTMLARWTHVPDALQLEFRSLSQPQLDALDVASCGSGWLRAVLVLQLQKVLPPSAWQLLKLQPAGSKIDVAFFLQDDASVDLLLQALGSVQPDQCASPDSADLLSVVLSTDISPWGICKLLEAAGSFPCQRLAIKHTAVLDTHPAPQVMQALPSGHFKQLRNPCCDFGQLKVLHIANCSLLTALDMATLAAALHNLTVLHMQQASGATDAGVCAFVACRLLAELQIMGCPRVSRGAALVLLATLRHLVQLRIDNVCDCQSRRACQEVLEQDACPCL